MSQPSPPQSDPFDARLIARYRCGIITLDRAPLFGRTYAMPCPHCGERPLSETRRMPVGRRPRP